MFRYKFFVDSRLKESTVKLRITYNRKKAEVSMGFTLAEAVLEDALSLNPCAKNIRWSKIFAGYIAKLEQLRADIIDARGSDIGVSELKERIAVELSLKAPEHEVPKDFFMPFFLSVGASKAKSTFDSFRYTQSLMQKFQSSADRMVFEDITYAWLSDMEAWMKKKNLSQNTRKIHFGNIRIAMREAYKRGVTDNDPFRRFTFRPEKTRKRSISVEMLRELFNYPVEPYAELYRDMFKLIFMLIGINSIDLFNLKSITPDGRIEYKRAKTGRLYSIKVEPEAMEIIEKYRGKNGLLCIADRWTDYRNFRHQMNKAIKDIGVSHGKGVKRSASNGPFDGVTSYWMRHTWATIARSIKVLKGDISLSLGHGDGNPVTSVYIDEELRVVDEANRRVLDWVLYGKR